MESHEAGFPPFPHSHGLDDWIYVFSCPLHSNRRHRKGLVTDVSGPQRNACPGTLTHFDPTSSALGGPSHRRRGTRISAGRLSSLPSGLGSTGGGYADEGSLLPNGEGSSVRVQVTHDQSLPIKISLSHHAVIPLPGPALRALTWSRLRVGEPFPAAHIALPIWRHPRN